MEGTSVTGVTFVEAGEEHTVTSSREVILSDGEIESPRILMMSGIGEREQPEAHGIDVVHDLPVTGKIFTITL